MQWSHAGVGLSAVYAHVLLLSGERTYRGWVQWSHAGAGLSAVYAHVLLLSGERTYRDWVQWGGGWSHATRIRCRAARRTHTHTSARRGERTQRGRVRGTDANRCKVYGKRSCVALTDGMRWE